MFSFFVCLGFLFRIKLNNIYHYFNNFLFTHFMVGGIFRIIYEEHKKSPSESPGLF
tara:strand:+ start:870 stop:1037 length:168 start_codon:yes stop_codon:yes gene_type:complete